MKKLSNVARALAFVSLAALVAGCKTTSAQIDTTDSIPNDYRLRHPIAVREKAQKQLRIQTALQIKAQVGFPAWVEVDEKKFTGTFKQLPDREEILPDINENLVVELYSK